MTDSNASPAQFLLSLLSMGGSALVTHAIFAFPLRAWGRRVAERQQGLWWDRAARLPIIAFGIATVAVLLAILMLVVGVMGKTSSGTSDFLDLVKRFAILAYLSVLVPGLMYGVSFVAFTVGQLKQPASPER